MAAMAGFEPAILPDKGRILQREVVSVSLQTDPSCGGAATFNFFSASSQSWLAQVDLNHRPNVY
jgi:hypothetical protein